MQTEREPYIHKTQMHVAIGANEPRLFACVWGAPPSVRSPMEHSLDEARRQAVAGWPRTWVGTARAHFNLKEFFLGGVRTLELALRVYAFNRLVPVGTITAGSRSPWTRLSLAVRPTLST